MRKRKNEIQRNRWYEILIYEYIYHLHQCNISFVFNTYCFNKGHLIITLFWNKVHSICSWQEEVCSKMFCAPNKASTGELVTHAHTYAHARTHTHACARTRTHARTYTRTHARTSARTRARTHHTHTHHTHTHTHTHVIFLRINLR